MAGAWLVHLYTASSAFFAFLALTAIDNSRYRDAFLWLGVALVIDATDGAVARFARVRHHLPDFDGAKLDDIVDYLTYVFVPAVMVWHVPLVPEGWSIAVAGAILIASAYGFNTAAAKTPDHFFTGFPSYWNIVAFYLYVAGWPRAINAAILLVLAALVFVPVKYVYPSRTPHFRSVTLLLGSTWAAMMFVMLWSMPIIPAWLVWLSLVFPVYYVVLSIGLELRKLRS